LKKQIFIVDDHPVMRASLRSLLDLEQDLSVCGDAATAAEALSAVDLAEPDLILIDVSLSGTSGIDLAHTLRERYPGLYVVMLTAHREENYMTRAFEAGVHGYIVKDHLDVLVPAIRRVLRGREAASGGLAGTVTVHGNDAPAYLDKTSRSVVTNDSPSTRTR
jgi:DNA-binding NarL/FixJ family response regulator